MGVVGSLLGPGDLLLDRRQLSHARHVRLPRVGAARFGEFVAKDALALRRGVVSSRRSLGGDAHLLHGGHRRTLRARGHTLGLFLSLELLLRGFVVRRRGCGGGASNFLEPSSSFAHLHLPLVHQALGLRDGLLGLANLHRGFVGHFAGLASGDFEFRSQSFNLLGLIVPGAETLVLVLLELVHRLGVLHASASLNLVGDLGEVADDAAEVVIRRRELRFGFAEVIVSLLDSRGRFPGDVRHLSPGFSELGAGRLELLELFILRRGGAADLALGVHELCHGLANLLRGERGVLRGLLRRLELFAGVDGGGSGVLGGNLGALLCA